PPSHPLFPYTTLFRSPSSGPPRGAVVLTFVHLARVTSLPKMCYSLVLIETAVLPPEPELHEKGRIVAQPAVQDLPGAQAGRSARTGGDTASLPWQQPFPAAPGRWRKWGCAFRARQQSAPYSEDLARDRRQAHRRFHHKGAAARYLGCPAGKFRPGLAAER